MLVMYTEVRGTSIARGSVQQLTCLPDERPARRVLRPRASPTRTMRAGGSLADGVGAMGTELAAVRGADPLGHGVDCVQRTKVVAQEHRRGDSTEPRARDRRRALLPLGSAPEGVELVPRWLGCRVRGRASLEVRSMGIGSVCVGGGRSAEDHLAPPSRFAAQDNEPVHRPRLRPRRPGWPRPPRA